MTTTIKTFDYVAESGNLIRVENYIEKFARVSLWGVYYKTPRQAEYYTHKDGLLHKPNNKQIQQYIKTL